ncbi:glycerol-3-phosphate dehydrogenase [Paraglaciecola sp.]|uniref:glycerol-3-phosphate dehydrogenase n=1 Tax=Paraglaciecola sp. TaxID=1920173 RepID=UPI0030F3C7DE
MQKLLEDNKASLYKFSYLFVCVRFKVYVVIIEHCWTFVGKAAHLIQRVLADVLLGKDMNKEKDICDILVVGGGVNGVGVALDAAGRGLSVTLCEMNDLASATSSNSSKLIHGGLRYLEHYEFRLVREALAEREVLLSKAPHIMWPMRFILPHRPHLRPAWMIRVGLFLYDHLAKRVTLKGTKTVKFDSGSPLIQGIAKGFEYSDGWVDDARLVVLNAVAAKEKGASIRTRTRCVRAKRTGAIWEVQLLDTLTNKIATVFAKTLVNAAGPWVTNLFDDALHSKAPKKIRLIKGSHIIVPKIHDQEKAYILQNEDNRIVFVIPYEGEFSLIGTTDIEHFGDPSNAQISEEEMEYIISVSNAHFKTKITRSNIVHAYSGVRPLVDDESESPDAVTRDYTFEIEKNSGEAPLLSIFGGKITTYRKLSEAVVDEICTYFPDSGNAWTAKSPLPGGNFNTPEELLAELKIRFCWLPEPLAKRLVRTYGTLTYKICENANSLDSLGIHFGANFYQTEIEYLIENEWALTVDDIIWRRTKMGLFLSATQIRAVSDFITHYCDTSVRPRQMA